MNGLEKKEQIWAKHSAERLKKWQDHFKNHLLGQPPVVTSKPTIPLPINTENISMEELVKCVNGIKNGKAARLDNIPIEYGKVVP